MRSSFARKVRVALTPPDWVLTTTLSNGALVSGRNRAGWGGRGVFIFGDALEPELAALDRFLHEGHVFLDIGANVGVFTVKAAREVGGSGLVIAVEPFIEMANHLHRNIELNGYRNCRVRNLCVTDRTGEMPFYRNRDMPNSYSLRQDGRADALSVFGATLDDLCSWENLERLDYLKIDAEGAEDSILAGGTTAIERFRPIIQIEVTLGDARLPRGYQRFTVPRGVNNVFIPSERTDAIETARSLDWVRVG